MCHLQIVQYQRQLIRGGTGCQQGIFYLFHACHSRTHEAALFQNIFKFCTFLPKFSNIFCPFSEKSHECPYFLEQTLVVIVKCESCFFIFGRKKCFMVVFLLKYSFAHFATAVISSILTHTPRNVSIYTLNVAVRLLTLPLN